MNNTQAPIDMILSAHDLELKYRKFHFRPEFIDGQWFIRSVAKPPQKKHANTAAVSRRLVFDDDNE